MAPYPSTFLPHLCNFGTEGWWEGTFIPLSWPQYPKLHTLRRETRAPLLTVYPGTEEITTCCLMDPFSQSALGCITSYGWETGVKHLCKVPSSGQCYKNHPKGTSMMETGHSFRVVGDCFKGFVQFLTNTFSSQLWFTETRVVQKRISYRLLCTWKAISHRH